MRGVVRFLHGALGGLIPPASGLFIATQTNGAFDEKELLRAACLSLVLVPICGYYAYLQTGERNALKLLQISLGVPALLTALAGDMKRVQTTKELEDKNRVLVDMMKARSETSQPPQAFFRSPGWLFPTVVHAAAPPGSRIQTLEKPQQSMSDKVAQAIFGRGNPPDYFVISASYSTESAAQSAAALLAQTYSGFNPQVFAFSQSSGPFAVVLGRNLTYEQAVQMRTKALNAGLPASTNIWTYSLPLTPILPDQFTLFQRRWRKLHDSVGSGIYVYLADVSKKSAGFNVHLVSSTGSWTLADKPLNEKGFLKWSVALSRTSSTFPNSAAQQTVKLGNLVLLVKVLKVNLGGNESVQLEITRLL